MIHYFLKKLLLKSRYERLIKIEKNYAIKVNQVSVEKYQLDRFNHIWRQAQRKIPFYRMWQEKFGLPQQINSLHDLKKFPLLTKQDVINNIQLIEKTPGATRYTLTGGTSGLTTKFPMNHKDAQTAWLNTHLGRRWNGLSHTDSLFMIWGHSHLFSGRYAKLKQLRRQVKDFVLGIKRMSAYDMSPKHLERIYTELTTTQPRYIIGYGSCLSLLAKHIEQYGHQNTNSNLKLIVNTSEPIAMSDVELVSRVFDCPVANEYGMAEAGVIGYSVEQTSRIHVMWQDYILGRKNQEIIITTIGERCFPLINYSTEDYNAGDDRLSMTEIDSIQGKVRAVLTVGIAGGEKTQLSVVLLDHILKQLPAISSVHYEQTSPTKVKVMYFASEPIINSDIIEWLRLHLSNEGINVRAGAVIAQKIDKPLSTLAGKRAPIINNDYYQLKS